MMFDVICFITVLFSTNTILDRAFLFSVGNFLKKIYKYKYIKHVEDGKLYFWYLNTVNKDIEKPHFE